MAKKSIRCCGYVRTSTIDPDPKKTKSRIASQKSEIKKYAEYENWQFTDFYEDIGISGAKKEIRPGFLRMMEDAKEDKFDFVVVRGLARFGRNVLDTLQSIKDLEKYDVAVYFVKEKLSSSEESPTGRLFLNILSSLAEWEKEMIRVRTSTERTKKWVKKDIFLGRPPLGYDWDKKNRALVSVEPEKRMYLRIVDLYLRQGLGMKQTANRIDSERDQFIGARNIKFSSATISHILKNDCYTGSYVCNKTKYVSNKDQIKVKGKIPDQIKVDRDPSEHIRFEAPQYISVDVWEQIQRKTKANTRKTKNVKHIDEFWLRDMLYCSDCDYKLTPKIGNNGKNKVYNYYACYWKSASKSRLKEANHHHCTLPFLPKDEVEQSVWTQLMIKLYLGEGKHRYLGNLDLSNGTAKKLRDVDAKIQTKTKKQTRLITKRDNLFDLLEDENYDKVDFKIRLEKANSEIQLLEQEIKKLKESKAVIQEDENRELGLAELAKNPKEILSKLRRDLDNLAADDKKYLIEAMTSGKISVDHWKEGKKNAWHANLPFKFNAKALQYLVENKKIGKFKLNYL